MGLSLNLTGVIWLFQNRHGNCKNNDRGHCHFLNLTYNIGGPVKGPNLRGGGGGGGGGWSGEKGESRGGGGGLREQLRAAEERPFSG